MIANILFFFIIMLLVMILILSAFLACCHLTAQKAHKLQLEFENEKALWLDIFINNIQHELPDYNRAKQKLLLDYLTELKLHISDANTRKRFDRVAASYFTESFAAKLKSPSRITRAETKYYITLFNISRLYPQPDDSMSSKEEYCHQLIFLSQNYPTAFYQQLEAAAFFLESHEYYWLFKQVNHDVLKKLLFSNAKLAEPAKRALDLVNAEIGVKHV